MKSQISNLKSQNQNSKLKTLRTIIFEFSFLLFSVFCFLFSVAEARAEGVSLSITPPNIVIQTEAPAIIEKQLQITNNADNAQTLSITFKPFTQSDVAGKPLYKTDLEIFENVQILDGESKIKQLTLLPKQQKNLKLQIALPEDQPNQDYYFSIILISKDINQIETPSASNSARAITHIQTGIAANVLLSIFTGKKQLEGIVDSYKAPFIAYHAPVEILLTFQNTGSYLLIPQGTVLITNMFGQTVGKIPVPRTIALANSKRDIKLTWSENILFGPYNATLYLGLADNKEVSFKRSTTLIGFPLAIGASIMALIIALIIIRARLQKYRN